MAADLAVDGGHRLYVPEAGRKKNLASPFPTMLRVAVSLGGSAQPSRASGRGLQGHCPQAGMIDFPQRTTRMADVGRR